MSARDREQARAVARRADEGLPAPRRRAGQAIRLGLPGLQETRRAWRSPMDIDLRTLSDEEKAILDFAFHRYFDDSGLFGTVDDALARVEQLKRIGVTRWPA
jgi:hypothetical protein